MRFSAYSYTNISDVIENAVSSFHTEYYQSTSNTELIGGKWSITIPPWENGKYYWQKTITTFSDPNKTPIETKPVCITGGVGSDGRGIKSIIPEYAKNTSGTTAPVSGWSHSRPTWNQGEYIWTRFKITYNDGSNPEYTTPTCDSSWEVMNNLEIGGRNLLKSTSSITGYKPNQRNWSWENWGIVLTNTTDTATDSIHIVTPGGDIDINSGVSFLTNDIKYKKGERYTFSIAIRGTYNSTDKFVAHIWYETATSSKYDSSSTASWIDNQDGINDGISSVIFQRRFISFAVPEDFDETKNKLRIVISCKKMDILLCRPQLEKGNKPTDWKRAEEDIQEQFTSVIKTLSGVSSKVDTVEGKITNKIWQTDINNAVNNYDESKVESIRDKVAHQEQTINGFNQTVKDMQTTITTKADGSTVETIKNNVSSLTQDLSGFKTTVESTYATNDNLKNNYFTKTETQQLSDKIYWIVSDSSTSSSLTLTSQALTAMTNQFVVKSPDGKRVVIQKGQILLDALKSNNYSAPTSSTGIYAAAGTFYDLSNGSITSKNFVLDSNGNISLKGTVYATSGSFTGDIVANSLTLGSKVQIPESNISGISSFVKKDTTIGTVTQGSSGFQVSSNGLLKASNAIIYGTIYAESGIIGGCNISNGLLEIPAARITGQLVADQIGAEVITVDKITSNNLQGINGWINLNKGIFNYGNGKLSWDGTALNIDGSGTFTGTIYASNSEFSGKVTALSGSIGGCNITDGKLIVPTANITGTLTADKIIVGDNNLDSEIIKINSDVLDAAKTATNFVKLESGGITVGNLTNYSLGNNVFIDSDSVDIRNGTTVLASFAANQIDLGKNNRNAIINLCSGSGKIKYKHETIQDNYSSYNIDGIEISSSTIKLLSENAKQLIDGSHVPASTYINSIGGQSISIGGDYIATTAGSVGFMITGDVGSGKLSPYIDLSVYHIETGFSNSLEVSILGTKSLEKVISDKGFESSSILETFENNILWTGTVYPLADQVVTLSSSVSTQPHGIIVVFTRFDTENKVAATERVQCFFVPKQAVTTYSGKSFIFMLGSEQYSYVGAKRLFISNGKITGSYTNNSTGSAGSNIKYNNNQFCLTRIIGV